MEGRKMAHITLTGTDNPETDALVEQLTREDILGQLLCREGKMRELGLEGGDVKLDWVDGVEKALQHPEWLRLVEEEAADIVRQGIRHVIWSGMGGSVQTVYTLKRLGYLDLPNMHVYPCDSTDPASLNRILQEIVANEGKCSADILSAGAGWKPALQKTMMIGVSMGMTSEEPITHLEWFAGLLEEAGLPSSEHIQVMTLPGSYLDQFARPRGCKMVPIQLDGENHTPGRMSAPATRVFIRPVCLALTALRSSDFSRPSLATEVATTRFDGSLIRRVLERAQELYGVSEQLAVSSEQSPFVRLGAFIANEVKQHRRNKVMLVLPPEGLGLAPWVEQLVEESLGKDGKGFLIFYGEDLRAPEGYADDVIFLQIGAEGFPEPEREKLDALRAAGHPVLKLSVTLKDVGVPLGLPELAGLFLGFKLTVATFGYLRDIVFVGQPAVEAYKKYARDLRESPQPVTFDDTPHKATFRSLTLDYNSLITKGLLAQSEISQGDAVEVYAAILRAAKRQGWFRYKDFTFNGELTPELRTVFEEVRRTLVNGTLKMRGKIRTGPSDYHSTEQSETDGPNELISTRFVALKHEPIAVGNYSDKFLLAQARGTWQAMEDANRWILMVTMPELSDETVSDLRAFFEAVNRAMSGSQKNS
jgi:glucose-6-phosphate isomerase